MRKSYLLWVSVFICLFLQSSFSSGADFNRAQSLFSLVDRLSFRKDPGLKSKVIGYLGEGEKVKYLGEKSNFTTKITLRGKSYNEQWIKVKRPISNEIGWVYAGGVSSDFLSNIVEWRAIIIYDPHSPEESSEDWGWFSSEVATSAIGHGIIVLSGKKNQTLVIKRGDKTLKRINLSKAMKKSWKNNKGYLLLKSNKKAKFIQHDMTDYVLKKASSYFGFKIKAKVF